MTLLSLEKAIELEGGLLCLDSTWRRVEDLTLSRSGGERNPLLEDAERRRRLAGGEPTLSMSLSADYIRSNALLADCERRVREARKQQECARMQEGGCYA